MTEVTEQDFATYREIQIIGVTNMLNIKKVIEVSESIGHKLDKETIREIMDNYSQYRERYGGDE